MTMSTAENILSGHVRYDREGAPLEVVIPYDEFIDFMEAYGIDLSKEEKVAIREAEDDRKNGRHDRFISLDDVKSELCI